MTERVHWTQTEAGREKLRLRAQQMHEKGLLGEKAKKKPGGKKRGRPVGSGRKKKVHWTQRPGGRERMAKIQRASHRRRRNALTSTPLEERSNGEFKRGAKRRRGAHLNGAAEPTQEEGIGYAFHYVENFLETYGRSRGIPLAVLTARVGSLLHSAASR